MSYAFGAMIPASLQSALVFHLATGGIVPVPPGLLFLQVAVILALTWALSRVLAAFEQPPVMGQLIAGVLLGPSVLGWLLPNWETALVPSSSLPVVNGLGEIGVALYMFNVGFEIDLGYVRHHVRTGAAVGAAGVIVPLALGALLGSQLVHDQRLFPRLGASWAPIAFFGASMAVTAFPVMAAILTDRGMMGTSVANLSLMCGSFSDLTAWTLVAVVLAGIAGTPASATLTLGGAAAFVALVVLVLRRPLRWLLLQPEAAASNGKREFLVLMLLLLSAWWGDLIGIHPAFGAFVLGTAVPRTAQIVSMQDRLRPFVLTFLLPLYFTYSGLNTSISLLNSPNLVLLTALIVAVAFAGKALTCGFAARVTGQSFSDSVAIAALMNARGLVELVILAIGLQHGLITPTLFAMMVAMTVVTTLAAAPVLRLVYGPMTLAPSEPTVDDSRTVL